MRAYSKYQVNVSFDSVCNAAKTWIKKNCGPFYAVKDSLCIQLVCSFLIFICWRWKKNVPFREERLGWAESAWLRMHFVFRLFLVTVICEFILTLFHSILIQFESINALIQAKEDEKHVYMSYFKYCEPFNGRMTREYRSDLNGVELCVCCIYVLGCLFLPNSECKQMGACAAHSSCGIKYPWSVV